jgi:hypothetical protein
MTLVSAFESKIKSTAASSFRRGETVKALRVLKMQGKRKQARKKKKKETHRAIHDMIAIMERG